MKQMLQVMGHTFSSKNGERCAEDLSQHGPSLHQRLGFLQYCVDLSGLCQNAHCQNYCFELNNQCGNGLCKTLYENIHTYYL